MRALAAIAALLVAAGTGTALGVLLDRPPVRVETVELYRKGCWYPLLGAPPAGTGGGPAVLP